MIYWNYNCDYCQRKYECAESFGIKDRMGDMVVPYADLKEHFSTVIGITGLFGYLIWYFVRQDRKNMLELINNLSADIKEMRAEIRDSLKEHQECQKGLPERFVNWTAFNLSNEKQDKEINMILHDRKNAWESHTRLMTRLMVFINSHRHDENGDVRNHLDI